MKSDKKIFLAFCLNMFFSLVELIGGIVTGSIAIISDSIHDFGDGMSIGISFVLEKISHKKPDDKYTYGYYRYSVLGSVIQSVILLCGSVIVAYNGILRLINPEPINVRGMLFIALFGFFINFAAAYFTSGEGSLNQKAINLHMLEDVLGWLVIIVTAVVMRFTSLMWLDPVMSLALSVFVAVNALKSLKAVLDIFLEKTPKGMELEHIKEHLLKIEGVLDVHHLHVWSMDGYKNSATLHVVTDTDTAIIKKKIRDELSEHNIHHTTIECETSGEVCETVCCEPTVSENHHHHHHHH